MKVKSKKHVYGNRRSKPDRTSSQEDRAWSKALAKVEKLGRSLCKPLPSDPTVAKCVAITVGVVAVMENLFPPGTVPSLRLEPNKYLRVPDAETWAVFRKQAEMVYRKAHSCKSNRGRPSDETNAFMSLLKLSPEAEGMPTYGEMVKALMEELKLSKNTAYKYAKLYHLSLRWTHDQSQLTHAERKWFAENKGTDSWSRLFWMGRYLFEKRRLEKMGGSELF